MIISESRDLNSCPELEEADAAIYYPNITI